MSFLSLKTSENPCLQKTKLIIAYKFYIVKLSNYPPIETIKKGKLFILTNFFNYLYSFIHNFFLLYNYNQKKKKKQAAKNTPDYLSVATTIFSLSPAK